MSVVGEEEHGLSAGSCPPPCWAPGSRGLLSLQGSVLLAFHPGVLDRPSSSPTTSCVHTQGSPALVWGVASLPRSPGNLPGPR